MIGENDKEIEGLLRRLAKTESSAVRVSAGEHIDADEISVFAENALPGKARTRVTAHIADCTRCRTILSNVVALRSAESVDEVAAPAGAPIGLEIPWYRKLFAVRNLATALGVLVVLFAGVFAIFLIRNMTGPEGESVAQLENANVADSGMTAADAVPRESGEPEDAAPARTENQASEPAPAPAATPEVEEDVAVGRSADRRRNDNASGEFRSKRQADIATGSGAGRAVADSVAASPGVAREAPATVPSSPPPPPRPIAAQKAAPEARKMAEADRAADKDDAKSELALAANAPEEKEASISRRIGGKIFNQRNSVWYDSSYAGQPTTNVRRKTAAYRALDAGLRDITDKLTGTVVVVWKEKAYRID